MNSLFHTKIGVLPLILLSVILIVSFQTMVGMSREESGTMDELAHIPSGYSYVRYLDFRLNPEHPPILKALSGFPLLFIDPKFPTESEAWTSALNGQWDAGAKFLYESGNNADQIIQLARLGPMILTLLLIILIYYWSHELVGKWWAFLPTLMFGLSPHTLAHGHLVTTDIAAAFGIVFGTYFFLRFLRKATFKNFAWGAFAFGIAGLMKFSTVLLIPYFVVLATLSVLVREPLPLNPLKKLFAASRLLFRKYAETGLLMLAGFVFVIYPVYFLFTVNYPVERQLKDTTEILSTFANGPTPPGENCAPKRCAAEAVIWMSGNPVFRPAAQYALGILMVIQRSAGGNTAYFLGEVTNTSWRHYFPMVYLLKEPIAILILILSALGIASFRSAKSIQPLRSWWNRTSSYINLNFTEVALLIFVLFYWAYSIKSTLNIGFRHLFPIIPFTYMLATMFWKKWAATDGFQGVINFEGFIARMKNLGLSALKISSVLILMLWFFFETALSYPYHISYFNQFGGGTNLGYRSVTDSNYDWGQDLRRLQDYLAKHPEIEKIAIDYFGAGAPEYYLGENRVERWWSAKGNPLDKGIRYFVVSVNNLQGSIHPTVNNFSRPERDEYRWLTMLRPIPEPKEIPIPDARIGTTLLLYRLK